MIAYLRGRIIQVLSSNRIIVGTNGIGYKVGVLGKTSTHYRIGDEVELYTHLVIRENRQELYGFTKLEELQIFELLIDIPGVGPKMALGILQIATPQEIQQAALSGNVELFRSVSGIGKKNAGRIVLELRSKLDSLSETNIILPEGDDVVEALKKLGYRRREIGSALKAIDRRLSPEEQIKAALRILGS